MSPVAPPPVMIWYSPKSAAAVLYATPPPPEIILIDPIPVPPVSLPAATPRKNSAKRGQVVALVHAPVP
jgi:hypothetical protein